VVGPHDDVQCLKVIQLRRFIRLTAQCTLTSHSAVHSHHSPHCTSTGVIRVIRVPSAIKDFQVSRCSRMNRWPSFLGWLGLVV
jgi:hypothetical protein